MVKPAGINLRNRMTARTRMTGDISGANGMAAKKADITGWTGAEKTSNDAPDGNSYYSIQYIPVGGGAQGPGTISFGPVVISGGYVSKSRKIEGAGSNFGRTVSALIVGGGGGRGNQNGHQGGGGGGGRLVFYDGSLPAPGGVTFAIATGGGGNAQGNKRGGPGGTSTLQSPTHTIEATGGGGGGNGGGQPAGPWGGLTGGSGGGGACQHNNNGAGGSQAAQAPGADYDKGNSGQGNCGNGGGAGAMPWQNPQSGPAGADLNPKGFNDTNLNLNPLAPYSGHWAGGGGGNYSQQYGRTNSGFGADQSPAQIDGGPGLVCIKVSTE